MPEGEDERLAALVQQPRDVAALVAPAPGGVNQGAGSFNKLTVDDAVKIKQNATLISGVSPIVSTKTQVIAGGTNWRTSINGVSTDYPTIRSWNTDAGEFFTDELADLGSKDAAMQTRGVWIIELSELDSLSHSEVARIKGSMPKSR